MAAWPGSLPQRVRLSDFTMQAQSGTARTEMDAGPEYTRRRFTAVSEPFSGSMVLTDAQYDTLEAFFKTTLGMGADAFDWVHPFTGAAIQARFLQPPGYRQLAGDSIEATMAFEVLP